MAEPFQGCHFPPLDWALHTTGRSGSFEAQDASIAGNYLFVVGDVRSVQPGDVGVNAIDNFSMTGPFTKDDRNGLSATTHFASIQYQQDGSGVDREFDNEIGIAVVDTESGEPLGFVHFPNFHSEFTYGVSAEELTSDGSMLLGVGGKFTGSATFPETTSCIDMEDYIFSVRCSASESSSDATQFATSLNIDFVKGNLDPVDVGKNKRGYAAYLMAAEVDNKESWNGLTVQWATIPWSGTWDATVSAVVVDPSTGNVLAVGLTDDGDLAQEVIDSSSGWVGVFSKTDGSAIWKKEFPGLNRMYGVDLDAENDLVCFRADKLKEGQKMTICLDSTDGSLLWERSFEDTTGSFGDIKFAKPEDGPYIYAEISASIVSVNSLDPGTPYAACVDSSQNKVPSYQIVTDKLLTEADCLSNGYNAFIPSTSTEAVIAHEVPTGITCGNAAGISFGTSSCIAKFHKFTGRPQWATFVVQTRGMETSPDGPLITGPYRPQRGSFADVNLPDTGSNTAFQALLDKETGEGVYVQTFFDNDVHTHSNAAAMDRDGNFYLIVRSWATNLRVANDDYILTFPTSIDMTGVGTHRHMLVMKVLSGSGNTPVTPKCLVCNDQGERTGIKAETCYIDQMCFDDRTTAIDILEDASLACNAAESQTEFLQVGEKDDSTCNVCGKGKSMTKSEAIFDASLFNLGEVECGAIDMAGQMDSLPSLPGVTCDDIAILIGETCGCMPDETLSPTSAPADSTKAPSAPINVPELSSDIPATDGNFALSPGAIIGIVVGSLVFVGLLVLLYYRLSGQAEVEFDSSSPAIRAHKEAEQAEEGQSNATTNPGEVE